MKAIRASISTLERPRFGIRVPGRGSPPPGRLLRRPAGQIAAPNRPPSAPGPHSAASFRALYGRPGSCLGAFLGGSPSAAPGVGPNPGRTQQQRQPRPPQNRSPRFGLGEVDRCGLRPSLLDGCRQHLKRWERGAFERRGHDRPLPRPGRREGHLNHEVTHWALPSTLGPERLTGFRVAGLQVGLHLIGGGLPVLPPAKAEGTVKSRPRSVAKIKSCFPRMRILLAVVEDSALYTPRPSRGFHLQVIGVDGCDGKRSSSAVEQRDRRRRTWLHGPQHAVLA